MGKMKLLVFLATVVLISARSVKIDQIEYGFCPDSPEPGTIDNIDVQPFPISLVTGSSLTIAATLTLNEAVPTGATVSLDLKKEGLIPLPIPCLEFLTQKLEKFFTLDLAHTMQMIYWQDLLTSCALPMSLMVSHAPCL